MAISKKLTPIACILGAVFMAGLTIAFPSIVLRVIPTPQVAKLHTGCATSNTTALTIDADISLEAIDILKKYNVTATFFPNRNIINTQTCDKALADGYVIGNIRYTHPNMKLESDDINIIEIIKLIWRLVFLQNILDPLGENMTSGY
jgi:hypothetical protein